MALHKNQTRKVFSLPKNEGKMDLPDATHDTVMLDCASKESAVSNLSPHDNADIMEGGSPSKLEPGDGTGATSAAAAAAIESAAVEAPPAISQPEEEMEAVAQVITEPDKETNDVASPAIEVPADVLDDGAPQVTLEHAADLRDATPADVIEDVAPSAVGESGDLEAILPFVTESSPGKGDASAAASPPDGHSIPPSMVHEGADTGMEDEVGKAIADNPENGQVNSSGLDPELDIAASDAQDPGALLVESRVNLSRIPNSPESTH